MHVGTLLCQPYAKKIVVFSVFVKFPVDVVVLSVSQLLD